MRYLIIKTRADIPISERTLIEKYLPNDYVVRCEEFSSLEEANKKAKKTDKVISVDDFNKQKDLRKSEYAQAENLMKADAEYKAPATQIETYPADIDTVEEKSIWTRALEWMGFK